MATERQIAANRENALRSTGPRTAEGKSRSSGNATRHGLSGSGSAVLEAQAERYEHRLATWQEEIAPATDLGRLALGEAVAASVRAEVCGQLIDGLAADESRRATLAWRDDRRNEANDLAERLSKSPRQVAGRLASTRDGAELMIASWTRLGQTLQADKTWTEADRSRALDLLGVEPADRVGRTRLTPTEGTTEFDHLRNLAAGEAARLAERKRVALDELDEQDRLRAESALLYLFSRPAQLLLRYERDARRHFFRSLAAAKSPDAAEPAPRPLAAPAPAPRVALASPGPFPPDEPEPTTVSIPMSTAPASLPDDPTEFEDGVTPEFQAAYEERERIRLSDPAEYFRLLVKATNEALGRTPGEAAPIALPAPAQATEPGVRAGTRGLHAEYAGLNRKRRRALEANRRRGGRG